MATLLALLLVCSSAVHFMGARVADPDLWQHVRYGRMICTDGTFPRTDDVSYTAFGAPLMNHEWLAQCALARLHAAGGAPLLVVAKLLLGVAVLAALVSATRSIEAELLPGARVSAPAMAVGLVLAMAIISPGMMFRPQLFTIALLALQGALLARADLRLRGAARPGGWPRVGWELAVQPLIMVVWANSHGGFLIGLFQLACHLAAVVLRHVRPEPAWPPGERPTRGETVGVAACAALAAFATLLNPHGPALFGFLLRTLSVHGEISEWEPVEVLSTHFLRFKILAAAAMLALVALWRARHTTPGARPVADWRTPLLAIAACAGFRHQRHTVLFAILATPLVVATGEWVRQAAHLRWPRTMPRRRVLFAAAVGVLAIALGQCWLYGRGLLRDGLEIRYSRAEFPVDAMAFLRHNGVEGNVAVPFEWGSYAVWKLAPASRVFIDGRFETVYPEQVIRDYFAFRHGTEGWARLLDDYPTDVVVARRSTGEHERLFGRPDFEYVYSDPAALVFVRRSEKMRPVLERLHAGDRLAFTPPEATFP